MISADAPGRASMRRMVVSALVVTGIAVVASGCSAGATTTSDARVVVAGQARLDEATDSVVLPLDKYAGPLDSAISRAQMLVTQKCMAQKGFDFQVSTFQGVIEDPAGFRLFGLWDMKDAEQYGYGLKPDPVNDAMLAMNSNMSAAEQAALPTCVAVGRAQFKDPRSAETNKPAMAPVLERLEDAAYESTMSDPTTKKLIAAWQKCMTDKGIKVIAGGSGSLGADLNVETTLEQQIKIAVQDVTCKTAPPDIIQQLVDIDASYQVGLIGKYQALLSQQLTQINAAESAAKKYIADNG